MLITVFTPTYNRASTLTRTFESLCRQRMSDFEWLIVDDGSIDDTETLVEGFKRNSTFDIRYIKQTNGGKHRAYNRAIELAKGDLLFTVDSDDWLPEHSLSMIQNLSRQILSSKIIGGLIALKEYPSHNIIGKSFSVETDCISFADIEKNGDNGERSIVLKTNVAKEFLFPSIAGEKFMTEAVVYDAIGAKYRFITRNDVLTTCEYLSDGLSSNPYRLMVKNPGGYMLYYAQRACQSQGFKQSLKYTLRYCGFEHLYKGALTLSQHNIRKKWLYYILFPLGKCVAWYYKYKSR